VTQGEGSLDSSPRGPSREKDKSLKLMEKALSINNPVKKAWPQCKRMFLLEFFKQIQLRLL
jgi:hypothetical protein